MPRLIVARHGQASLMKANYDELSPRGRAQATALGEYFVRHDITFARVFTGPARRHHDTGILAGQAVQAASRPWPEAVEIKNIDEHDAFTLVRTATSRHADDPNIASSQEALRSAQSPAERSGGFQRLFEAVMLRWLRDDLDVPEVESWAAFQARILAGLDEIVATMQRGEQGIAFSSVGPLAVLLQRALGTDDATSFHTAWRIRNASLTTFVFDSSGRLTLDGFNALPHLPDPRTWTFR